MSIGALTGRRLRRPSLRRPRLRALVSLRGLAVLGALLLVLGFGWLWFRSSSLVRIRQVTVVGLRGPDVPQIRAALTGAAESMTVLNLSIAKLDASVSRFAVVRSLQVTTHYPHAVTIAVSEEVPVAEVVDRGSLVVVDAAGRLLPGSTIPHGLLPTLPLRAAPAANTVTAPGARAAVAVLAAAPYRFLARVRTATSSAKHGVIVQLRDGPQVYFGPPSQLTQKWASTIAVLASRESQGAGYLDVSDPRRPAAGA